MKSSEYKLQVNDSAYEFTGLSLEDLDLLRTGENSFHVLHQSRSYRAELVSADYDKKVLVIRVNGARYSVRLADPYDQLVRQLGLTSVSSQVVKEVRAPMPGLVLELSVEEGEEVEKGKALIILEAMKMENIIKSPGGGSVKKIHVHKGQAVEKNQLLIEME